MDQIYALLSRKIFHSLIETVVRECLENGQPDAVEPVHSHYKATSVVVDVVVRQVCQNLENKPHQTSLIKSTALNHQNLQQESSTI
jgi:hypothetical protein